MKNQKKKPDWKIKREQQIQNRLILVCVIIADIIGIAFFIGGCERVMAEDVSIPVAGFTAAMNDIDLTIECEQIEIVEEIPEYPYTYEDLDLFAHLLYAEQGADWVSDETIYFTGSVVLNRINDSRYPDNLHDVIYQKHQYSVINWMWDREPSERCYVIAEDLLINGSILPANVLGQAEFEQMDGVYCYQDKTYFCYWD